MDLLKKFCLNIKNIKIKTSFSIFVLSIYVLDCYHVYQIRKEEENYINSVIPTEEEIKYLKNEYFSLKFKQNEVTNEEFKKQNEIFIKERDMSLIKTKTDIEKYFLLNRESIAFIMGARAAFLQLAHPYVASGIIQHSNIKNNIQKRFYMTFKYVFSMSFDTDNKALKSAKIVRRLHNKVQGKLPSSVGIFKKGHKYSASNRHALYWVYQTLIEGSLLSYEMFITRLTRYEKNKIYLKNQQNLSSGFGISKNMFPPTHQQFKRQFAVFIKSSFLTVNEDSIKIKNLLLCSYKTSKNQKSRFQKLFEIHGKWLTFMTLPTIVTKQFFQKIPSKFDIFLFCLYGGFIRFIYRLLPKSFRHLNVYFEALERLGFKQNYLNSLINKFSGNLANSFINLVLPSLNI